MYLIELAGEDDRLAVAEAAIAAADVTAIAPGLARASTVDLELAERLAFTRSVTLGLARAGSVEGLIDELEGLAFDREGTIAVRAHAVRGTVDADPLEVERRIGTLLVDRGFEVDLDEPDRVFRVLVAPTHGGVRWFAGWRLATPERNYGARRPPRRPFQQPGTMQPQLARALVNLSRVGPGEILLDPMCGPGSVLIEAALVQVHAVGMDVQRRMVDGAVANLDAFAPAGSFDVLHGSATALPVRVADAAVFDAPYGRQSPIAAGSAEALVTHTLVELASVVDRCVAVFDRPLDGLVEPTGWRIVDRFEVRVHRSLTRHICTLAPA